MIAGLRVRYGIGELRMGTTVVGKHTDGRGQDSPPGENP